MRKWLVLLLITCVSVLWGCEKADYEVKAEKSAQERAERNKADHEKREQ